MIDHLIAGCPHHTILAKLGTEDWDDAESQSLELHVETCERCQAVLQDIAAASRVDISNLIAEPDCLPDVPPALAGFVIEHELGRGGGAVVYLAEDLSTSRKVAIKLIPGGWVRGSSQRLRWMEEVRVAAKMQHHNIVRLYRVEETLHWFLLVFEYIPGGTLRSRLHQPVTDAELAGLMQTIALAVDQIHQQGVLHLDLKPSNILIDSTSGDTWDQIVPKVSDFGIARGQKRIVGEFYEEISGLGTPSYMAPEQIWGDAGQLSPATDVYGLGGILFTMLTGHPPFEGVSSTDILRQVVEAPIFIPAGSAAPINDGLYKIAQRCLEKRPEDRYRTPVDFANALQEWLNQQSLEQPTPLLSFSHETSSRPISRTLLPPVIATIVLLIGAFSLSSLIAPLSTDPIETSPGGTRTTSTEQSGKNPTDASDTLQLSLNEWVEEIALDPAAFNQQRAQRLVDANRFYTSQLLNRNPAPVDQWLQYGTLQARAAERISTSMYAELYPFAGLLLQDSIQLLESTIQQRPYDQAALLELIAARLLQGLQRPSQPTASSKTRQLESRQRTSFLIATADYIMRVDDPKQQIFWTSQILDYFVDTSWYSHWHGEHQTAAELWDGEQQFWSSIDALQKSPDLYFRHRLMKPVIESSGWPVVDAGNWALEESQTLLMRESIAFFCTDLFFNIASSAREPVHRGSSEAQATELIDRTQKFMSERNVDDALLPAVVHIDLIAPITGICTDLRHEGLLDQSECIQETYLAVCMACQNRFPNNADVQLAFCEAHLQAWKNALRRDKPDKALSSLNLSLKSAEAALAISPDSARARFQVADRIKRITRFQSATGQRVSDNSL